jgi:hypothetical protein
MQSGLVIVACFLCSGLQQYFQSKLYSNTLTFFLFVRVAWPNWRLQSIKKPVTTIRTIMGTIEN